MAAYAAVVSLQHTINGQLNSSRVSSTREILEFAYKEESSLLQVLERLNESSKSKSRMERVDALEGQIRDCAHKLEDVIEFHELKLEEEEEDRDEGLMRQEIRFFGESSKRMENEYLAELSRDDDEDTSTAVGSSDFDFGVEMIGRSRLFKTILDENVLSRTRPDRYVCAMFGEQGSGSRVAVMDFSENALEAGKFERWGWARVGTGYELKHVLIRLIAQVEDVDDDSLVDATEDRLSDYLYRALENQRYMIVLDGMDDVKLLDHLITTSFPDQSNGSLVFLTTNSREVCLCSDVWYNFELANTYEQDIWLFVRRSLFGWESIPAELEVAGKEIVRNCRCLCFALAKTLVFLSKSNKTVEQWSKIAADKENPIFIVADEVLERSEIQKEMQRKGRCRSNLGIH